jgi:hypothetical protein
MSRNVSKSSEALCDTPGHSIHGQKRVLSSILPPKRACPLLAYSVEKLAKPCAPRALSKIDRLKRFTVDDRARVDMLKTPEMLKKFE